MQKPKALRRGDTLGLVGPSGAIRAENGLERAVAQLEELGFRVKVGESAGASYGYLSGSDELRARDLNAMFADDGVDGIICTKGGYGTPRILDRLDYDVARRNPKMLIGFSDITALHLAYGRCSELVTFHGPMPVSCMIGGFDEYSKAWFERVIFSDKPVGALRNCACQRLRCLQGGAAHGPLTGGNLSLICALMGTPWELEPDGKLLFIEDVGESAYRIDRMLTQLRLAGVFERCAGVIFGDFADCPDGPEGLGLTLDQVIADIVLPSGKPVLAGLCAGHGPHRLTLPLGIEYALDADALRLEALESAVSPRGGAKIIV